MLDFIELRIPFDVSQVIVDREGKHSLLGIDLLDLGINVGSRCVYRNEEGEVRHQLLHHPYDRLPTSFTDIAFKVVHEGQIFPYVLVKCSPAKILQGHNVFGSDNIEQGVTEMLGCLLEAYPLLYSILAVQCAEVVAIDVTYSARLRNDEQVLKVLDFLRNVSSGSLRKSALKYDTTVYWGSPSSKRLARKAYCKAIEFAKQLIKLKKFAKKGDISSMRIVAVMEDSRLQQFMSGLLRLECRFKKLWLEEHGIPVNVFDLIRHQRKQPTFLTDLWQLANKPLFEALEGQSMKALDHDSVYKQIATHFDTVTASGRKSTVKTRNLFNFFCAVELHGFDVIKTNYGKSQFYQHISDLLLCGFSKAYLQNLHSDSKTNVIPFVQLVKIDFAQQTPDWFVEPVSQFNRVA